LATNKQTKKYFKLFVQLRGMKRLENALQPASYKTLWCAGQSVEMIDEILTVKGIVEKMEQETRDCLARLSTIQVQ
jgi:nitronate monooxygenase